MTDPPPARAARQPHADLAARGAVSVGAARVDPATRVLAGPAGEARLEPRVLQVLFALIDGEGRTLTRDTLFATCWGGMLVDESALNRVIARIRRALASTGAAVEIQTVSKLGYRLSSLPPSPPAIAERRLPGRREAMFGGIGLVAVAAFGYGVARSGAPDARHAQAAELHRRALDALRDMLPARDADAIALLDEATRLAPGMADAWGALALAHQRVAEMGSPGAAAWAERRTRFAAASALRLDPGHADALTALALIAPVYRHWAAAEAGYRDLRARLPRHAPLLAGHAKMLAEVGRFGEAMAVFDAVFAIEPLGPAYHWRRGLGLWAAGRSEEANALLARALRIWPAHPSIWSATFQVRLWTRQDALALLDAPIARRLPPPQLEFMRAAATVVGDPTDAATDRLMEANRLAARSNSNLAEQAMALASGLGRVDEAFLLAEAYHFGRPFEIAGERLEPGAALPPDRRKTLPLFWPPMASARRDPRFARLCGRLGLEDYWTATQSKPDYRIL